MGGGASGSSTRPVPCRASSSPRSSTRRSGRRRPVIIKCGISSSCDDPKLNEELGKLSTQMANAPVNIVVAYGRDYSEEAWANIQSASAAIENMSLAAHALGLGTFWITQTGDAERVREMVGIALRADGGGGPRGRLPGGGPQSARRSAAPPPRSPIGTITRGAPCRARAIPRIGIWNCCVSTSARVRNGNRHNKPKEWERIAILEAFSQLRPPAADGAARGSSICCRPTGCTAS